MKDNKVVILGVCGSPRKHSSTQYVLEESLRAAREQEGVETQMILLSEMYIKGCNQCDYCSKNKCYCCHKDGFTQEVMEQFVNADGYLIASPVYNMNITWKLLSFFNRFRPLHKVFPADVLAGKVGGAIAVGGTRQGGQATAIQAIHEFYFCRQILITGGGKGAYSGGTVWSHDDLENGTKLDTIGMDTARSTAIKVAQSAKLLKAGKQVQEDSKCLL